ncbi:MAG: Stp1/IreP family PP2C-type Ser/Thr phosphatase [Bradymonadaceae bacterium]
MSDHATQDLELGGGRQSVDPVESGDPGPISLECVGMTDVGTARDHNEDDFYLSQGSEALCIVADGMGGHRSGEVASAMAIKSIVDFFRETMQSGPNGTEGFELDVEDQQIDVHQYRLVRAIQKANSAVFEAASNNEVYRGMGTTVVSGYFTHEGVYLAHIGDSRAYRFRDGGLEQRTDDHSLANEYVEMGILEDEDVEFFPYKNVITRACGLSEEVEVAVGFDEYQDGDVYLFCSDGLTDMVSSERIEEILGGRNDLESACRQLVEEANQNGGEDNITVVLGEVDTG